MGVTEFLRKRKRLKSRTENELNILLPLKPQEIIGAKIFSFGRNGHSLSSSGRWTDAKLFSTKKEAERVSKEIVSGFDKKENPKPHVRAVYYDDDSRRLYYDDDCKRRYHGK